MASVNPPGVSDSEFNMWRAVFAFALVDNNLSLEEQDVLRSYIVSTDFSPTQRETLKNDFLRPQNVETMYQKITEKEHKQRFCILARALVWSDGDMNKQEAEILRRVACMRGYPEEEHLRSSRGHPDVQDFYRHYAKAGAIGLMRRAAPGFQTHV